jgi:hypothetical protein
MNDARPAGSRRGRPWDEHSIREALCEFLHDKPRWPTYDEFIEAGLKGLRDVLPRFGGPERWSREMGLQEGPRPWGGVVRWTDDAIRSTLTEFLAGRPVWPTHREFRQAGLGGLYSKLLQEGTLEGWASEMRIAPPPPRFASGRRPPVAKPPREAGTIPSNRQWTDERITDALKEFLGNRPDWPPYSEFIETGRKGLYQAVLTYGGTRYWTQRMNVRWVVRRSVPYWTVERIRELLGAMLGDRDTWPAASEFAAAGEQRLLAAARRLGGIAYWASEFDVEPLPSPVADSSGQRVWTDERIAAALAPLIAKLGRWPTKGEFRKAGLGPALAAVYSHGGSGVWQRRFDLEPRRYGGPVPDRSRWNDQQIEAALQTICGSLARWPTLNEFEAAGLMSAYRAATRRHGIAWWRERVGFAHRDKPH